MTHDEEIKIEAEAESEEASEQEGVQQEKAKVEMREENTPKESEDMKEKMLRLAAEFDNYKKRTRKEVEEAGIIGKANLVKEILPVIDGFQLAIVAMEKSEDREMVKGVEMLYSNLMETLKRCGLAEVKTDGRFDPFRHEILMVKPSKEKEGTILEVVKKGYEFSGRMIRPASVIVAKPVDEKDKGNENK